MFQYGLDNGGGIADIMSLRQMMNIMQFHLSSKGMIFLINLISTLRIIDIFILTINDDFVRFWALTGILILVVTIGVGLWFREICYFRDE